MSCISAKISQIQAQATSAAQQKQEAAATNNVAAAAVSAAGTAAATDGEQVAETDAKKEEVGVMCFCCLHHF